MKQTQMTAPDHLDGDDKEINLIELLIVLAKHKKALFGLPLGAGVLAAGISFVLPDVYKANTKLLPPQQAQSSASALLSQLGGAGAIAAGVAGLKNPNDLYVGMLKSRTLADKLIAEFELKKAYETDSQEKARKILDTNTIVTSGKDGLITIEVEDKDRKRVAKLANAYVAELLRLTRVLAVTEASQRRVFFEQQLERAKNNLANAEMALKGALDTRGVISVDTESRAIVETTGRLRAQISAKEIELSSMRAFVTENNPNFRRVQEELSSLRSELAKLENGRADGAPPDPARAGNKSGFENIKLLRDVKYYQMLYELLAKQYEIARLDEAKDASIIQVLDPAVEPERRARPQRAMLVVTWAGVAFVLAVIWAFFSEARERAMQIPEKAGRWKKLTSLLRFK